MKAECVVVLETLYTTCKFEHLLQVVDAGAVVLLVLCVQEPELGLKRVAASALSDIAKHNPELAQAVVDAGQMRFVLVVCIAIHCLQVVFTC